ncbi:hypothetical protein KUH32_14490 [Thalassococcus sp. CAU 1522]|uniref:EF-hand domain-containing protein n=1 Tax=Thalassococcus arenae TaxID=2851652 RepID=A0ABS6NAD7_9RHOB|nr:hypothetical protein [Thalassococcus arenae]MBV2360972.1 hypothetical protein [Thalassococcus arenae]
MKKPTFATLTFIASTLPVLAMGQAAEIDANGDGMLSLDEVQAVYPDVSSDLFLEMDGDADGLLNPDEVAAAQEAGLMPASSDG